MFNQMNEIHCDNSLESGALLQEFLYFVILHLQRQTIVTEVFCSFSQTLEENTVLGLKLSANCFLPCPFQLIINSSTRNSTLYILSY
jgi:hypothetical protein